MKSNYIRVFRRLIFEYDLILIDYQMAVSTLFDLKI